MKIKLLQFVAVWGAIVTWHGFSYGVDCPDYTGYQNYGTNEPDTPLVKTISGENCVATETKYVELDSDAASGYVKIISCTKCRPGYRWKGVWRFPTVSDCPIVYYTCEQCPVGKYSGGNATSCEECPGITDTPKNGAGVTYGRASGNVNVCYLQAGTYNDGTGTYETSDCTYDNEKYIPNTNVVYPKPTECRDVDGKVIDCNSGTTSGDDDTETENNNPTDCTVRKALCTGEDGTGDEVIVVGQSEEDYDPATDTSSGNNCWCGVGATADAVKKWFFAGIYDNCSYNCNSQTCEDKRVQYYDRLNCQ